eukprot:tig00021742_g23323.t1
MLDARIQIPAAAERQTPRQPAPLTLSRNAGQVEGGPRVPALKLPAIRSAARESDSGFLVSAASSRKQLPPESQLQAASESQAPDSPRGVPDAREAIPAAHPSSGSQSARPAQPQPPAGPPPERRGHQSARERGSVSNSDPLDEAGQILFATLFAGGGVGPPAPPPHGAKPAFGKPLARPSAARFFASESSLHGGADEKGILKGEKRAFEQVLFPSEQLPSERQEVSYLARAYDSLLAGLGPPPPEPSPARWVPEWEVHDVALSEIVRQARASRLAGELRTAALAAEEAERALASERHDRRQLLAALERSGGLRGPAALEAAAAAAAAPPPSADLSELERMEVERAEREAAAARLPAPRSLEIQLAQFHRLYEGAATRQATEGVDEARARQEAAVQFLVYLQKHSSLRSVLASWFALFMWSGLCKRRSQVEFNIRYIVVDPKLRALPGSQGEARALRIQVRDLGTQTDEGTARPERREEASQTEAAPPPSPASIIRVPPRHGGLDRDLDHVVEEEEEGTGAGSDPVAGPASPHRHGAGAGAASHSVRRGRAHSLPLESPSRLPLALALASSPRGSVALRPHAREEEEGEAAAATRRHHDPHPGAGDGGGGVGGGGASAPAAAAAPPEAPAEEEEEEGGAGAAAAEGEEEGEGEGGEGAPGDSPKKRKGKRGNNKAGAAPGPPAGSASASAAAESTAATAAEAAAAAAHAASLLALAELAENALGRVASPQKSRRGASSFRAVSSSREGKARRPLRLKLDRDKCYFLIASPLRDPD